MFLAIARCGQPEPGPKSVRFAGALVENQRTPTKASAVPPQPQVRAVRPTAARARPKRSQAEQHTMKKADPCRSASTKHGAAWASQSAISTRSACLPTSCSCTLHACKSAHCSAQVSARRRCNPKQVASAAKGRHLTLPSSGQSKGCALRLPLMSNVGRHKENVSEAHASRRCSKAVKASNSVRVCIG